MRATIIVGGVIAAMLIMGNLVLPEINPWLEAAVSFVRLQLIFIGVPTDVTLTVGIVLHFVISIALVWSPAFIAWRSWRRIRSKPWVYDWKEMQRNPWKYDQRNVNPKPPWQRLPAAREAILDLMTALFVEIVVWIAVVTGLACIAALIIFFQR